MSVNAQGETVDVCRIPLDYDEVVLIHTALAFFRDALCAADKGAKYVAHQSASKIVRGQIDLLRDKLTEVSGWDA